MNIRWLKKGDLILIVSIGIMASVVIACNTFSSTSSSNHITAVITQDGKVIKSIDLSALNNPETVSLDYLGIKQVITAEKGKIRFSESECRDKICIKFGWLTKTGDNAVCMPAKTVITIVGDNKQLDSISY